ncbi:hypothetical protein QYF52_09765 [Paenibacillus polymyxa]|uniref:hypothetical protein n=1 Tax=Paenibacillus polymyxa TaxID=1406 RepID=UPI0025B672C8|nr:hypothetical protein [Paenibacillus polymyxa]MDN4078221.1 hypothetical protein [Paenibacillus polymyxa]MDN4103642.1 hypothetical protein [Paenibacillus polymyxa]MDN4113725.1 hypothetical protein [Paenibacillus polymyxa]
MIVDKLMDYYEENISDYGLVYKFIPYHNKSINIFTVLYFLTGIIMLICLPISLINNQIYYRISFIPFFLVLVVLMVLVKYEIRKIKKMLEKKYKIHPEENKRWKTEKYTEKQYLLLLGYLKRNKLDDTQKIEQLIKIISDEVEQKKLSPLLAPGLLIVFITPLWNHLIPVIFSRASPDTNLEVLVAVSFFLIFLIVLVLFTIGVLKRLSEKVKDDILAEIFWKEKFYKKELIAYLQDISFNLQDVKKK